MNRHGPHRRHHCEVARQILVGDFGDVVAKVCLRLLSHGPATLPELYNVFCRPAPGPKAAPVLTKMKLRDSLLVLAQHNIVRFGAKAEKEVKKRPVAEDMRRPPIIQYEASIDEILARPLFPRMLLIVRHRLGELGLEREMHLLLQQLMLWGRLSSERLMENTLKEMNPDLAADAPELTDESRQLHGALSQLQKARFIVQSEVMLPSLFGIDEGLSEPLAMMVPPAAKGKRKRKGEGLASEAMAYGGGGAMGINTPLVGIVGGRAAGGGAGTSVLWRVHLNRFVTEFKHMAIERMVGNQINENAELLVRLALGLTGADSMADSGAYEELFTVDDLKARCPARFPSDEEPVTWEKVCNYLDVMCQDPMCEMASTLNGKYVLKLGELGNAIKQLVLEDVVCHKVADAKDPTGASGCRLFRILLRSHSHGAISSRGQQKMEIKQLAEQALMPERDARPLLLKLLQLEYVLLQEVPKTNDRNPKTTTHLWHVSLPHAYATLEVEILMMLAQLYARLKHETGLASQHGTSAHDVGAQRASARLDCIEHSIMRLHVTLLLLRTL